MCVALSCLPVARMLSLIFTAIIHDIMVDTKAGLCCRRIKRRLAKHFHYVRLIIKIDHTVVNKQLEDTTVMLLRSHSKYPNKVGHSAMLFGVELT